MNDYIEHRLRRIHSILAHHLSTLDLILAGKTTNLETAKEFSLLLDLMDTKGSDFKQDCKEVEAEAYRLADKEGLIHE